MNYHSNNITTRTLWIPDAEVRAIFASTRCYYTLNDGWQQKEATGVFVREKRANDGTLGYVLNNPISGKNWLWIISRKNRKPFAICIVS